MFGFGFGVSRRSPGGGASPWTPASLFGAGEKGAVWDFSDASSLWKDAAGTIPVVASGDLIKRANDLSPNGNHLTRELLPPPWNVTDGIASVRFNQSFSHLDRSGFDLSGCSEVTVVFAMRQKQFATQSTCILGHGLFIGGVSGFEVYQNFSISGALSIAIGQASGYYLANGPSATSTTREIVWSGIVRPGATNRKLMMRLNGDAVRELPAIASGVTSAAVFGVRDFTLGARSNGSQFAQCDIMGCVVIGRALTNAELKSAEEWCAERAGVTIPHPYFDAPSSWSESGPVVNKTDYLQPSAFARVDYTTTATSLNLGMFNSLYTNFGAAISKLGVLVNGEYHASAAAVQAGSTGHTISLPAGTKTVSIISGAQSGEFPVNTLGAFLTIAQANAPLIRVNPAVTNRLLVYGDSISVGANSTDPHENGWFAQLRAARHPASTMLEGRGFRSLYEDCSDASARATFVAKIVAANPATLWMAIGTNDYGLNRWSAAAFGAAYAVLLDDLHAALPSLVIYCQTPLLRGSETANGSGSTMGAYRTQISAAVSTRTSFATLIDGTAIMTTGSLVDGVHPDNAGMDLYAAAVLAAL